MINKINLLPWRDHLLSQEKTAFRNSLILSVLIGLTIVILLHSIIKTQQSQQLNLNHFIRDESKKLEMQIINQSKLETHTQVLINEIALIKQLQMNQLEIVQLIYEIPTMLPDGIYLSQLSQNNREISFEGKTESHQQVSQFMQSIEHSQTLMSPSLQIIKTPEKQTNVLQVNDFSLTATLRAQHIDTTDDHK